MLESLLTTITATSTTLSTGTLLSTLCVTLLLGALVSLVHMKTNKSTATSQGFSLTLVMLPAVIAIIILLVGTNIASAFSLAGAFSIIRFRSAPGNPKDITYVLFSMAVGLAGGMGFLLQAFLIAIVLCGIMTILELTKFGSSKSTAKLLKITIPENLNYQNAFDDVMKKISFPYLLF
ncbi:MAG: DUF4956 domain-containing protein [Clostridiales bacterium]|nr:DUF4956 domain-containing protein [Clostridiales bacterium]